jgi:DNA-binding NtrC family response regulator
MGLASGELAVTPRGLGCVLVVEDEFLIRMLLADELRDVGYQVIEAVNADEALEVLRGVTPDAIISDVRMPGSMDGMGLLAAVRQSSPNLPVIMMSAHADPADFVAAGANQFLSKPFRMGAIVEAVRRELDTAP